MGIVFGQLSMDLPRARCAADPATTIILASTGTTRSTQKQLSVLGWALWPAQTCRQGVNTLTTQYCAGIDQLPVQWKHKAM